MDLHSVLQINWWKSEINDRPRDHIAPALALAGSTVIVTALWGKYQAACFVAAAVITYPFAHYQFEYLKFIDIHETAHAAAVIAIQVFCMKIPFMSQWALPMSIVLGYAITVRGMRIRHLLHKQGAEIATLQTLNGTLKAQVDALHTSTAALKEALTTLKEKRQRKKDVEVLQDAALEKRDEVVIQIEADFTDVNKLLSELTELCKIAIDDAGISKQLAEIDENQRKIAENSTLIEIKNKELTTIIEDLKNANVRFNELIDKARVGEIQTQELVNELKSWYTNLSNMRPAGL